MRYIYDRGYSHVRMMTLLFSRWSPVIRDGIVELNSQLSDTRTRSRQNGLIWPASILRTRHVVVAWLISEGVRPGQQERRKGTEI